MVPALTDTQRRFLAAVMQRLPLERVQEVYLFSPLKQGGVETGVAVIAAGDDAPAPGPGDGAVRAAEESDPTEAAARDDADASGDATGEVTDEATEDVTDVIVDDAAAAPPPPSRSTIFTARYRLQLKGPDRGKWEVDVVEEADAPLVTVDAVVRGVQRRAGELSAVERLSPADLVVALDDRPWARP